MKTKLAFAGLALIIILIIISRLSAVRKDIKATSQPQGVEAGAGQEIALPEIASPTLLPESSNVAPAILKYPPGQEINLSLSVDKAERRRAPAVSDDSPASGGGTGAGASGRSPQTANAVTETKKIPDKEQIQEMNAKGIILY